jgi:hypothetical protein
VSAKRTGAIALGLFGWVAWINSRLRRHTRDEQAMSLGFLGGLHAAKKIVKEAGGEPERGVVDAEHRAAQLDAAREGRQ